MGQGRIAASDIGRGEEGTAKPLLGGEVDQWGTRVGDRNEMPARVADRGLDESTEVSIKGQRFDRGPRLAGDHEERGGRVDREGRGPYRPWVGAVEHSQAGKPRLWAERVLEDLWGKAGPAHPEYQHRGDPVSADLLGKSCDALRFVGHKRREREPTQPVGQLRPWRPAPQRRVAREKPGGRLFCHPAFQAPGHGWRQSGEFESLATAVHTRLSAFRAPCNLPSGRALPTASCSDRHDRTDLRGNAAPGCGPTRSRARSHQGFCPIGDRHPTIGGRSLLVIPCRNGHVQRRGVWVIPRRPRCLVSSRLLFRVLG